MSDLSKKTERELVHEVVTLCESKQIGMCDSLQIVNAIIAEIERRTRVPETTTPYEAPETYTNCEEALAYADGWNSAIAKIMEMRDA